MTRETKVGLLVGMGVILLVGIIVSDHLAVMQHEQRAMSDFADRAQGSIQTQDPVQHARPAAPTRARSQGERRYWIDPIDLEPDMGEMGPVPASRGTRMPPAYALDNTGRHHTADVPPPPDLGQRDAPEPALRRDAEPEPAAPAPQEVMHRVRRNESLYAISEQYYGDGRYWHTIAEHNADKLLGGEHVREGIELAIPNFAGLANTRDGAPSRADAGPMTVVVEAGDTLGELALRHLGTSRRWRELQEANADKLRSPRDLRAGMTLRLPAGASSAEQPRRLASASRTYTIRRGDTLSRIAERELGDSGRWRDLYDANRTKLNSPDTLPVGEELLIPS